MQRAGLGESTPELLGDDPAAIAYDTREWLRAESLWEELSPAESALLSGPFRPVDLDVAQNLGLQTEAFAALAWSIGLIDDLSDGDYTPLDTVFTAVPSPWQKTAPWISSRTLRAESALAFRREQAEIWEWRLAMEPYRRQLEGRELLELEETIMDIIRDGTAQGLLRSGNESGFTFEGKPLTRLHPLELEELHMLAQERLIALNWLCGHGKTWDEAPLDIEGLSMDEPESPGT